MRWSVPEEIITQEDKGALKHKADGETERIKVFWIVPLGFASAGYAPNVDWAFFYTRFQMKLLHFFMFSILDVWVGPDGVAFDPATFSMPTQSSATETPDLCSDTDPKYLETSHWQPGRERGVPGRWWCAALLVLKAWKHNKLKHNRMSE